MIFFFTLFNAFKLFNFVLIISLGSHVLCPGCTPIIAPPFLLLVPMLRNYTTIRNQFCENLRDQECKKRKVFV